MKLYELEKIAILKCLEHYDWNRTITAKSLGLSIRTIRNKIDQFKKAGMNIPDNGSRTVCVQDLLRSETDRLHEEVGRLEQACQIYTSALRFEGADKLEAIDRGQTLH